MVIVKLKKKSFTIIKLKTVQILFLKKCFYNTNLAVLKYCVQLFANPWTVAYQDPLIMRFSRQEYWRGLPFPFPRDLPLPGTKPRSLTLQANSLLSKPPGKSKKKKLYPKI